jgi:hypothetical protein
MQSAKISGRILTVQIKSEHSRGEETRLTYLPIHLDEVDWGLDKAYITPFACGRGRTYTLARPPRGMSIPISGEGIEIPVHHLRYLWVCDLLEYYDNPTEDLGLFVVDPPSGGMPFLNGRSGPPDRDHLPDPGLGFFVVAKDRTSGKARTLFIDSLEERQRTRKYLYAVTPATAAIDIVTFPFVFLAGLVFLAGYVE